LTRGGDAFVGQHTGDLEHPAAASFYDEVTEHLSKLLEVKPDIVVADCHPNFYTSAAAADLAARSGAKLATLQHHAAHAAAVLAEHQIYGPALALVLDGYGYGLDGTVWGGELLRMDLEHADWGRAGHLTPFALPGGDAATRAPWRLALSLALGITDRNLSARVTAGWEQAKGREAAFIRQMLERGVNSPLCSSCGRLFDAVSAQLHVCLETSYEGQAAIRLETLALQGEARAPSIEQAPAPVTVRDGMALLDSHALFARVCRMQEEGLDPALIALDFHHQLAWSLVRLVLAVREPSDRPVAGLAGGVVNNTLLRRMLVEAFAEQGISVLVPSAVPAGDGGISLGQAAWGLALLRNSQDGVQSRQ
ncbi:MAG: hydrogenase maturation protein HypF, partial [Desulfovibrionaceae bacterium]|nr:hydrogenase maturation protein HypF [Desulfovibrionaceae bacterium]